MSQKKTKIKYGELIQSFKIQSSGWLVNGASATVRRSLASMKTQSAACTAVSDALKTLPWGYVTPAWKNEGVAHFFIPKIGLALYIVSTSPSHAERSRPEWEKAGYTLVTIRESWILRKATNGELAGELREFCDYLGPLQNPGK